MSPVSITPVNNTQSSSLRISEIFQSLQGESSYQGYLTTFIRLTGCPLRCQYCDSAYAFSGGKKMSFSEIFQKVESLSSPYVCVTGGEPLAQRGSYEFINTLASQNYRVSVETSGALPIQGLNKKVKIVMDIKTPGSQEASRNNLNNLNYLKPHDEVKFVLCSYEDFVWACQFIQEHNAKIQWSQVLFSPSYEQIKPVEIADWIVKEKLAARLQIQLHKYLWGDQPGK